MLLNYRWQEPDLVVIDSTALALQVLLSCSDREVRHHGGPVASRLTPSVAGMLRTAQAELASRPDHERIVAAPAERCRGSSPPPAKSALRPI